MVKIICYQTRSLELGRLLDFSVCEPEQFLRSCGLSISLLAFATFCSTSNFEQMLASPSIYFEMWLNWVLIRIVGFYRAQWQLKRYVNGSLRLNAPILRVH